MGILKKSSLEDNDQNKDQDQSQKKDQSQTEDTYAKEENIEHQDLPKNGGLLNTIQFRMSLEIFLRALQLGTALTTYVTIWLLFPKLRQRNFMRPSSMNTSL